MAEVNSGHGSSGCFLCPFDTRRCTVGMVEGALLAVRQQRLAGRWLRDVWVRDATGRQLVLALGNDFGPLIEALVSLPATALRTLTLRAYHLDASTPTSSTYRATPATVLVLEPDVLLSITDLSQVDFCRRRYALRQIIPQAASAASLRGSLIHTSFKEVLKTAPPPEHVEAALSQHLERALDASLLELALCEASRAAIWAEAQPHLANLGNWYRQQRQSLWGRAPQVRAETFLLAPEVGLKGRIDLLWEDAETRLLLELKTGAANGALPKREHRWQVYGYYTLLAARRAPSPKEQAAVYQRYQPAQAALLYSAAPGQAEAYGIPFSLRDLRRVMEARNLLALIHATGVVPPPPGATRCERCSLRTACAAVSSLLGWQPPAEDGSGQGKRQGDGGIGVEVRTASSEPGAGKAIGQWFSRYLHLLHLEGREAERQQSLLWRLSRQERVAQGLAIDQLRLTDEPRQTASEEWEYSFRCENMSEIREGDEILLSDGDPIRGAVVSGSVLHIGPDHVTVWTPERIARPALIDRYGTDIVHRRTIHNLYRWLHMDARLRALVSGEQEPRFVDLPDDGAEMTHLNPEQQEAVRRSLRMRDYLLIQGPPGTGKTQVVSEIVRRLVARGERVLLAAFTNQAVDNLLKRLRDDGFHQFVRLGHDFSVDLSIRPYRLVPLARSLAGVQDDREMGHPSQDSSRDGQDELPLDGNSPPHEGVTRQRVSPEQMRAVLAATPVVASTTATWSSELYDVASASLQFDVAIVDEAGQLTVPAALGALRLAQRFILVGDERQLAPLVLSREAAEGGLATSLFALLRQRARAEASVSLVRQYRMHAVISAFPGREFYDGRLQDDPSVANSVLVLPGKHAGALARGKSEQRVAGPPGTQLAGQRGTPMAQAILDPARPMVFVDISRSADAQSRLDELRQGEGRNTRQSLLEAMTVREVVRLLLEAGITPGEIGIIAPYRAQVATIRHQVLPLAAQFGGDLTVDTVDRFQGGERLVMILSFAMGVAPPPGSQIAAFLSDEHRLNVALTRARSKLVLVGHRRALAPLPIYRRLLNYCVRLYPGGVVEASVPPS